jgi:hypothetical protein
MRTCHFLAYISNVLSFSSVQCVLYSTVKLHRTYLTCFYRSLQDADLQTNQDRIAAFVRGADKSVSAVGGDALGGTNSFSVRYTFHTSQSTDHFLSHFRIVKQVALGNGFLIWVSRHRASWYCWCAPIEFCLVSARSTVCQLHVSDKRRWFFMYWFFIFRSDVNLFLKQIVSIDE